MVEMGNLCLVDSFLVVGIHLTSEVSNSNRVQPETPVFIFLLNGLNGCTGPRAEVTQHAKPRPPPRRYLVGVVRSQQVGGERLQLVLGHVLQRCQAAARHRLLQVNGRVAQGVHGGRRQFVAGVQDLHRRYAHHAAVQGA